MTTIPVQITVNKDQLPKLRQDFANLNKEAKKALQDQMRELGFQRRVEGEINRELKQQIAERRRLMSLTEKLNKDLAKQGKGGGFGGMAGGAGGSLLAGAATLGIGAAAADFTKDSFTMAAASERLEKATHNLGRQHDLTADQIVAAMKRASDGTISGIDAMQAANKAMLFGIVDNEKEFEELTKIGVRLGRAMGLDAKTSIDDFTTALGRQSKMILDNLGIIINVEKANQDYARSLNKTVEELSAAEKQQAFTSAALEAGREKIAELGDEGLDTAGKVERLTAGWADFQVKMGELGDTSGALDALNTVLSKGIEGAESWKFVIEWFDRMTDAQKKYEEQQIKSGNVAVGFNSILKDAIALGTPIERQWLDWADALANTRQEEEAYIEVVQDQLDVEKEREQALDRAAKQRAILAGIEAKRAEQAENAAKLAEEETKRLEKLAGIREDFARSLIELDQKAQKDNTEAWADYFEGEADNWKDHSKTVVDLRKDAGKDLAKIDRDLAKDLKRNAGDLQKDLAKITKNEQKDLTELKKKAAKDERQESRKRQIDTRGDERLFQFELRALASEGEANAIQAALERRAIEQQIEAEKQAEEQQVKQQNLDDDVKQIREAAQVEREEARATADERAEELRAEAEEQKILRQEALTEALAEEKVNYEERLAELRKHREEKLAEIEQGKQEAVAKIGEELTQVKDMTKAELKALVSVAAQYGEEFGAAFSGGMNKGFDKQDRVSEMLSSFGGGKPKAPRRGGGGQTSRTGRGGGNVMQHELPGYANEGQFRVGGSGGPDSQLVAFRASPEETVTISKPGGSMGGGRNNITIQINNPIIKDVATMQDILRAIDEYDDLLSSVLN